MPPSRSLVGLNCFSARLVVCGVEKISDSSPTNQKLDNFATTASKNAPTRTKTGPLGYTSSADGGHGERGRTRRFDNSRSWLL